MGKIVVDAARRLNTPPYQVFVRAYAIMGHPERIASPHWEEYRSLGIVPDIVEHYCLDILTNRTPVVHGRGHVSDERR